ncbi:transcriptional regulator [Actinoplanes capillaceus]|uniref:Transcriptional regulator n=1 Tax=Actinoplanes campanulatus TaxID=113559 RepID=A0ABQ3WYE7_9ACTN|nr:LuxR family transcriptional regulator [Actinoplanes capillaceus]GID51316.1 transcriptional regulator [Actinoplanes capillaceus]
MLYGREAELAVVDELLATGSGALIVRGEAGIGKSALLAYAAPQPGARVLRVTGAESEADLPFAALHLLLRPVLDRLRALPAQQSEALRGALGLGDTPPGDRFLVGLATLNLLVDLSETAPVRCLVDDAQWLDGESADALMFAARRLHTEPVMMLFAARDGFPTRGLTELRPAKLTPGAARRLLARHAADLPPAVRDQLVHEAQGNPLALIELPRMLTGDQRNGAVDPLSFAPGTAQPVADRVLLGFRDRIAALPAPTRTCLLLAALDHGDASSLARAADRLGASPADLAEAERAGLVRASAAGVVFHHPLVRTAVLLACDIADRIGAHRALAETAGDDRRAWHLAAVTSSPDENLAEQLENLAVRARLRGGQTAVSAAYARAAELSADAAEAVRRWTAAAGAAAEAGLWLRAGELVGKARRAAETATPARAVRADLAHVRAGLAVEAGRPLDAVRLLHDGAEAADDPGTRLSLLGMAGYYTWASAAHPDQVPLARRTVRLCPDGDGLAGVVRTINDAFRQILAGEPVTTDVFQVLEQTDRVPFELRFLVLFQAIVRAEHDRMLTGAVDIVEDCRAQGRVGRMPQAMTLLAIAQLMDGRHPAARATAAEGMVLATDVGRPFWRGYLAGVHAWLSAVAGREQECEALTDEAIQEADQRQWMPGACWAEYARVGLDLGLGRYGTVLDRVDQAMRGPTRHAFIWRYCWPDYVEAAVRAGEPHRALDRLHAYAEWAQATGRAGTLAILHRARALLAPEDTAGDLYERALLLHARSRQPFDEARTSLVYGEWLRRHRGRAEARPHLRAAMEAFDRIGAAPWSARAATELRAAGLALPDRSPTVGALATLTPQELQVVRLAVTGASNREIGAQLFLSPRTVASHLYKAFPKLGVTSRVELARFSHLTEAAPIAISLVSGP